MYSSAIITFMTIVTLAVALAFILCLMWKLCSISEDLENIFDELEKIEERLPYPPQSRVSAFIEKYIG